MTTAPTIQKLEEIVINRIAAGEVVQKPSAAIKEMLENSLDAGSTQITVTIKGGGLQLMQIQDNGHGIRKDDLEIVCERFTTSKLSKFEDLRSIATFGFRGEALASITHVAHVHILTKTKDSPCAYKAKYSDGKLVPTKPGEKSDPKPCAGVTGTTITVEDLFYNMPTRRLAFKNPNEQYLKVLDVVSKYSIHFADRSMTCKKHGQAVPDLHTPASSTALDNIRIVYGSAVARELIDLNFTSDPTISEDSSSSNSDSAHFKVTGKITNANYSCKKGTCIIFINNRLVECSAIKRVLESIYTNVLPKHTHPFAYLAITMPPQHLDVNVHPTKKEVHFLFEDELLESLYSKVFEQLKAANDSRVFFTQSLISQTSIAQAYSTIEKVEDLTNKNSEEAVNAVDFAAKSRSEALRLQISDTAMGASDRDEMLGELEEDQEDAIDNEHSGKRRHIENDNDTDIEFEGTADDSMPIGAQFRHNNDNDTTSAQKHSSSVANAHKKPKIGAPVANPNKSKEAKTQQQSSASSSSSSAATISANKLVRTDAHMLRIDAFFKPLQQPNRPPTAINGNKYDNDNDVQQQSDLYCMGCTTTTTSVQPAEEWEGEVEDEITPATMDGNACLCCGKAFVVQPASANSYSNDSGNISTSSSSGAASNPLLSMKQLIESPCQYDSIARLRSDIHRNRSQPMDELFKHHTFVGVIDWRLSLVQHQTKLLVVDHHYLLRHMFYQIAVRRFGGMSKMAIQIQQQQQQQQQQQEYETEIGGKRRGSGSVSIARCVLSALEADEEGCGWNAAAGSKTDIAQACSSLLAEKADMLSEYFSVVISPEMGVLLAMPELVEGYRPDPASLGLFLLRLATETDWTNELPCFRGVCQELANYYSVLAIQPSSLDGAGDRDREHGTSVYTLLTADAERTLTSLLLPAMRTHLLVPRQCREDGAVVEVAALEQLYKIFERC